MSEPLPWPERHQVALYLAAIVAGAAFGLSVPAAASTLSAAVTPILAILLFATFLGVPFRHLAAALRDVRLLSALGILNFVVAPLVAFGLSRFVAAEPGLLAGVLLVLLTPCVDYVVVFTRLAGGARDRLLAATPLLLVAQFALLPVYLGVMAGPELAASVEPAPFVEAFLLLIVLPLGLAVVVQLLSGRARAAGRIETAGAAAMVPLMMLTLAVVVASQVAAVGGALPRLAGVVPLFIAFAAVMTVAGVAVSRVARMDTAGSRALIFSGVTRNSLVVLPLALALPTSFALAPLVVVTQTLVELVLLTVLVWLVPRLARGYTR